jgi:microcystin-dependent protein
MGGTENVTLTLNQMPEHNHLINCDGDPANVLGPNPTTKFMGTTTRDIDGPVDIYSRNPTPAPATMNPNMVAIAGGSQPHANIQPYLTINFCIALAGIYPSRS